MARIQIKFCVRVKIRIWKGHFVKGLLCIKHGNVLIENEKVA